MEPCCGTESPSLDSGECEWPMRVAWRRMDSSGRDTLWLILAPGALVRPLAQGSLGSTTESDAVLRTLDGVEECILSVCSRPASRREVVDLVPEMVDCDAHEVARSIDELIEFGLLAAAEIPLDRLSGQADATGV